VKAESGRVKMETSNTPMSGMESRVEDERKWRRRNQTESNQIKPNQSRKNFWRQNGHQGCGGSIASGLTSAGYQLRKGSGS
jgi:anti-sigma-K factor RskA